jgi:hypothetical protein
MRGHELRLLLIVFFHYFIIILQARNIIIINIMSRVSVAEAKSKVG